MTIDIKGNPGTGNTFMEIHIQRVDNFQAFAPAANSNHKGTHAGDQASPRPSGTPAATAPLRGEILAYVDRLRTSLSDEWKSRYQKTWEDILDLDIVASSVYLPGKQQGTNFNRSLVAGIIHYLSGRGAYEEYNAARFASYLEGSKDHSVRSALGRDPSPDVVSRLDRYFDQ